MSKYEKQLRNGLSYFMPMILTSKRLKITVLSTILPSVRFTNIALDYNKTNLQMALFTLKSLPEYPHKTLYQ